MRKIICLIMVVLLFCATCVPVMADAQEIESSGITWELTDNDTTLIISGTGDMPNFRASNLRPWNSAATTINTVKINYGVTSIGDSAFEGCRSLQSITIPSSVTSIGIRAFAGCSHLQSLTIPLGVTSIGDNAFQDCSSLQSITIPSSVTSIGVGAFYSCSNLQSIIIPSSVTSIGHDAFAYCSSLQSITIPSSVTSIGMKTFMGCQNLKSITIPSSVTSIGMYAFNMCESLKSLTFKSITPPSCAGRVQLSSSTTVYVPHGAIDEYKANITWDPSLENSICEAYMVDILPAQHGTITVSKDVFAKNEFTEGSETVIVDAFPDEGYQLKSLTLNDAEITTDITEEMSFTMPCDNVTLTAEFELSESDTASIIANGNLTIIVSIVAAVVIAIAAIVILKKKQNS